MNIGFELLSEHIQTGQLCDLLVFYFDSLETEICPQLI